MKLSILNLENNYKKVSGQENTSVANPIKQTVPTQIEVQNKEQTIPSAASTLNGITVTEALKASSLAQTLMPYKFVGEIELPFSNNAKHYKMANGQNVIILNKKGPTVLKSYFNVGSMNEPDELRGISHFNEHMAFNGTTDGMDSGDFFKTVSRMGAMTNASTSFAQTDYYISSQLLHENDWDDSVSIHARMLHSPKHAPDMVEKEKGPVTSEISMVGDRPENLAMNNCIRNLFQIQSTSNDLIAGNISNINKLTNKDTLDYYNLWYTPDNCITVVTGEIDEITAMNSIAKHFNKYKTVATENRKYEEFKPIQQPVRMDLKHPKAQTSTIILGLKGPENSNVKENILSELFIASMMGYKGARMTKALKKEQVGLSTNVERMSNRPQDPKAIILGTQTIPSKTEEIIKVIYNEINNLTHFPLTQEELEIGKKHLKMAYSQISENSQMLNTLIGNALLDGNKDYISNYIPILESLTVNDMKEFVKKYIDLNKASLSIVHPENLSNEKIIENYNNSNTILKTNNMGYTHNIPAFKGRIEDKSLDLTKIKEFKLANNMEVIMNPNTSDIANVQMTLEAEAPANVKPAVPIILGIMLGEGSRSKTYEEFYDSIHKTGTDLSFDTNFNSISASSQSLSQDMPMAIESIKEVLMTPRLTPQSFEFAQKMVKEALLNSENTAMGLAIEKMFPNRPQAASRDTILKSIDSITLTDIQGFYNYIISNAMAKTVITAPTEKKPTLANDTLNRLSIGLSNFKPFRINLYSTYKNLEKDIIITEENASKQADVTQLYKFQTNFNPKDQMTFGILNTILGDGSYSRLFNDLREKQKLAYRVDSTMDFMGNSGIIALRIKTTTDDKEAGDIKYENIEKSLNGFNYHIKKIMTEKVSEEELNAAKLRIKTKILNSIETSASQTSMLSDAKESIYGIKSNLEKLKLIDEITADDILQAAQYVFNRPCVKSIIASKDTLENINIKATE